eukprot:CAMPEP_0184666488 /NCGR_PEP_ID=MMETSP0308-20130426/62066_1 /TAXON_ID=38269 /ORGANISM="Gloeochaete witrockiana, Strain SAG 46.84" /LENGTH=171 /DNA_ID=CAMNT_0027111113 /DNA_START=429 /DNA_END=944 /DNA_ORIENTATION=+
MAATDNIVDRASQGRRGRYRLTLHTTLGRIKERKNTAVNSAEGHPLYVVVDKRKTSYSYSGSLGVAHGGCSLPHTRLPMEKMTCVLCSMPSGPAFLHAGSKEEKALHFSVHATSADGRKTTELPFLHQRNQIAKSTAACFLLMKEVERSKAALKAVGSDVEDADDDTDVND